MDLTSLTPEQLSQLRQQLGLPDSSNPTGRTSEFRPRQLHDLNEKPSATNARPLFVWSAEKPANWVPTTPPFAQLLWTPADKQGKHHEVCAHSPQEVKDLAAQGYWLTPPVGIEVDPMDAIQAQFEALSPEDQKLLLEAQAQDKQARLRQMLAELPAEQVEKLVKSAKRAAKKTA